jgi:hypothetical protein
MQNLEEGRLAQIPMDGTALFRQSLRREGSHGGGMLPPSSPGP